MEKIRLLPDFLKNLLRKFLSKSKPTPLEKDETLSRFLFNRNTFNTTRVKANAFLPPENNLETSVFRRNHFDKKDYIQLQTKLSVKRGQTIKKVALIEVIEVLNNHLSVVPEESDYKWHANISNWPLEKDERKALAQELANLSTFE